MIKIKASKRYASSCFIVVGVRKNGTHMKPVENLTQAQVVEYCGKFKHSTQVKVFLHLPKRHVSREANIHVTTWHTDDRMFVVEV